MIEIPPKVHRLLHRSLTILGITKVRATLQQALADHEAVTGASTPRGRARGGGQSSKGKGRTGCQMVREALRQKFPGLGEDDMLVKATSMGGTDIHLSPLAQGLFSFGIEVKREERLNIWAALAQAKVNADKKGLPAIVFFSRSHTDLYVALRAEDFLKTYGTSRGPEAPPQGDAEGVHV